MGSNPTPSASLVPNCERHFRAATPVSMASLSRLRRKSSTEGRTSSKRFDLSYRVPYRLRRGRCSQIALDQGQMIKLPERVDRHAFWTWAIPLVIAHVGLSGVAMAGVNGMGALDALVIVMLAALVARRFRDIGWRGWIGGSFVIATMLVAPLAVAAYAIANNLRPAQFMEAMNEVGLVTGAANLVLLAVAGYVQSSRLDEPILAAPVVDALQPPPEASSPPVAADGHRMPNVFAMSAAIVALVVVVGISIALLIPRPYATSTPSAPSQVSIQGRQTQSNGLTKDTNDFLRQLSQHPPGPARQ